MLNKKHLQLIFNKLNTFKKKKYLGIYTNGLFFRRYYISDFDIHENFILYSIIHITSMKDIDACKIWDSINNKFVIILNTSEDIELARKCILKYPQYKIACLFPDNFSENFITHDLYTSWKNNIDILKYTYNKHDQINIVILKKLLSPTLTFSTFKKLVAINKGIMIACNCAGWQLKKCEYMY